MFILGILREVTDFYKFLMQIMLFMQYFHSVSFDIIFLLFMQYFHSVSFDIIFLLLILCHPFLYIDAMLVIGIARGVLGAHTPPGKKKFFGHNF